jgi:hypothetical protein
MPREPVQVLDEDALICLLRVLPSYSLYRRVMEVCVHGESVVLDKVQEEEEDHAVEELLAGDVPLLIRRDSYGEGHHKGRATGQSRTGEDAKNKNKAEDRFDKWDGVAEPEGETVRQRGLCEVFSGGGCECACAVIDADEAVTCEVDAEGDAEKRVGERLVILLHVE